MGKLAIGMFTGMLIGIFGSFLSLALKVTSNSLIINSSEFKIGKNIYSCKKVYTLKKGRK